MDRLIVSIVLIVENNVRTQGSLKIDVGQCVWVNLQCKLAEESEERTNF